MRNEFQDKRKYELNWTDTAKFNLPYNVHCRHSPSSDLNLCASGSLRKSNTARNLKSQIYHCRNHRLGHFALIHRTYVTMRERKVRTDLIFPKVQGLTSRPPSLRDTGTMRIILGVTFVASVAVRMNITLCLLHASY